MLNNTNKEQTSSIEARVHELSHYLLLLRKMQDKSGAEFLTSLGGLSMQELNVLNIIGDHAPCIMSDIAKNAVLSLSSVTVIVEKLVKANLVQRVRSDVDRRIVRGSLTKEGEKIYKIQIKHMDDVLHRMLNSLTIEEQENFLKIFQKILHSWQ